MTKKRSRGHPPKHKYINLKPGEEMKIPKKLQPDSKFLDSARKYAKAHNIKYEINKDKTIIKRLE